MEGDKLFDDVVDEFASISMIKSRLEKWKFQFPQSYQQAYLSLCLPKLFLPFVKLQLLSWNPLEVTKLFNVYVSVCLCTYVCVCSACVCSGPCVCAVSMCE